jgi:AbrB family looped-hinge helix DNA binding protein
MSAGIIQVNQQGRITISAPMRHRLGLKSGSKLVVRLDGDRIVLEKPEDIFKRLRSTFNSATSLVDELILERRAEAR